MRDPEVASDFYEELAANPKAAEREEVSRGRKEDALKTEDEGEIREFLGSLPITLGRPETTRLLQIAVLVPQLLNELEESKRAYDSLVRTTAEETPYWQAIARAADEHAKDLNSFERVIKQIPRIRDLPESPTFTVLSNALSAARAAGLTWNEET